MFDFLYGIFGYLFRFLLPIVGNYGLALVLFTVFFRVILLPTTIKQQKSSAKMVRLQPKLRRIREKYQDYNPQERNMKIQQETSELYQREGYSSMGASCAPLIVQLPILWGLYGIIRQPLKFVLEISEEAIAALTSAVTELGIIGNPSASAGKTTVMAYVEASIISNIEAIVEGKPELLTQFAAEIEKIRDFDFSVFGIDLGSIPRAFYGEFGISKESILVLAIPVLSGLTSLLTSVLTQVRQKKNNPQMENQQMMGCMMLSMPLMSLWFTWSMPVAMGMYWILSNILAFVQTLIIGHIYAPRKTVAKLMVEETVYRRSYEKNRKEILKNSKETEE